MRIVQSTWFPDATNIAGRWINEKMALFNFALSFHTLNKFYSDIVLYTDKVGYKILIEQLGLAYSEVHVNLEALPQETASNISFETYWVLRKLYTYSIQEAPFIHVDNDVYLFKAFDKNLIDAKLCAQNIEMNSGYYKSLNTIQCKFRYVPKWIKTAALKNCHAVNVGIIGGNNYTYFKDLYREIIEFIERNENCIHLVSAGAMNLFLEQYMVKRYADELNLPFTYQINSIYTSNVSYNTYKLHDAPKISNYFHIMSYKINATVCEAIAKTLYYENRNLHNKCVEINNLLANKKISVINQSASDSFSLKQDISDFFYRTEFIAASISEDIRLDFSTINSLISSVKSSLKMLDDNLSTILMDVFYFEYIRYEFACSLTGSYTEKIYNDFVEAKTKLNTDLFKECQLCLSINVKLIASSWLWVQKNEFFSSQQEDYKENIHLKSDYFECLIYYYPEQQKLKEQQLDSINMKIIRYAIQGLSVTEIIKQLRTSMNSEQENSDIEIVFESRIQYLIYQGVFHLVSMKNAYSDEGNPSIENVV